MEKSRFVKEKSKIPITVSWEGGVQHYSGLLDCALAGDYVIKPSNGWYSYKDSESKVRYDQTLTEDFWKPIFEKTDFKDFVKKQYSIGHKQLVPMEDLSLIHI